MAQRYEVTQDDKVYILSTIIINNNIRIECEDSNYPSSQIYSREYIMDELLSLSNIFHYTPTMIEVQNELNNSIERKQIRIINLGNIIEILFNIQINSFSQEISFQLNPTQNLQQINYVQNILPTQNINPIITVNEPIYNNINYPTYQTNEENDYPDCTYSTRAPMIYETQQTEMRYMNPLDQDRITKIELDSNLVKAEQNRLLERLNNLKMYIQAIKKQSSHVRKENGILNMKTTELKKIYKDLLEAEAALMAENDELRREKHELILKKNELDFYIRDHHSYDYVKEVNIPIDEKRRRPTNVSKREKQFGGGYTSKAKEYISIPNNQGYSSTQANKTYSGNFRTQSQMNYK